MDNLICGSHSINYLKKKHFQTNNIAYLLFSDIVNFLSLDSPYSMQYHSETKQFWAHGYKIFKGKCLHFIGGDKTSSRTSEQHNDNNMINYVVPDRMILQKQIDSVNINCEIQVLSKKCRKCLHNGKCCK